MQDGMDTKLQTQLALMNFHKKQVLCIGDRAGNCPMQDGRERYKAISHLNINNAGRYNIRTQKVRLAWASMFEEVMRLDTRVENPRQRQLLAKRPCEKRD